MCVRVCVCVFVCACCVCVPVCVYVFTQTYYVRHDNRAVREALHRKTEPAVRRRNAGKIDILIITPSYAHGYPVWCVYRGVPLLKSNEETRLRGVCLIRRKTQQNIRARVSLVSLRNNMLERRGKKNAYKDKRTSPDFRFLYSDFRFLYSVYLRVSKRVETENTPAKHNWQKCKSRRRIFGTDADALRAYEMWYSVPSTETRKINKQMLRREVYLNVTFVYVRHRVCSVRDDETDAAEVVLNLETLLESHLLKIIRGKMHARVLLNTNEKKIYTYIYFFTYVCCFSSILRRYWQRRGGVYSRTCILLKANTDAAAYVSNWRCDAGARTRG